MSGDNNYYRKVNRLVSEGRLGLRLVISPPRTGSTLLETALQLSPDIGVAVHEPFIFVENDNLGSDLGYRNIYESIGGRDFETSGQSAKVVVKELAHRLSTREEYKRLFSLTEKPVLFLIRDPLLSVESRIRKIIQTLPLKARLSTQQWMLDLYARELGYQNWQSMENTEQREIAGDSDTRNIYFEPNIETQGKLLDYYGTRLGFTNWAELSRTVLESQDYRLCEEILQIDPKRFIMDHIGKGSLEDQVGYMEKEGKVVVVDSTDFRLSPGSVTRELCALWSITYNDNMVAWGSRDLELNRGKQEFEDLVWYDTLARSEEVKPPLEIPLPLSIFPTNVREHLVQGDIPQYIRLFRNPNRITIEDGQRDQEFAFRVLSEDKPKLERFGVIPHKSLDPTTVTISDIDPIYALLSNPELALNQEYLERKKEYSDATNLLRREGVVQSVEGDFPGRRK